MWQKWFQLAKPWTGPECLANSTKAHIYRRLTDSGTVGPLVIDGNPAVQMTHEILPKTGSILEIFT